MSLDPRLTFVRDLDTKLRMKKITGLEPDMENLIKCMFRIVTPYSSRYDESENISQYDL